MGTIWHSHVHIVADMAFTLEQGIAYPRLGMVSINGGRRQKATKTAIALAQAKE